MRTNTFVNISALSGTPSFWLTFANTLDAGSPRSRAKAYVMRLDVVMMPIVAKTMQTRGKINRQTAPARDEVAVYCESCDVSWERETGQSRTYTYEDLQEWTGW